MAFKFILFSALIALSACGTASKFSPEKGGKSYVLNGTIQTHRPYCGGARPTLEMEKGFHDPLANTDFYMYRGERPTDVDEMAKITTDENGKFSIEVSNGSYSIIHADKLLSSEEFAKKYSGANDQYLTDSPPTCFEEWRTRADFTVTISDANKTETFTEKQRCFTGANPCIQYTGPYPP